MTIKRLDTPEAPAALGPYSQGTAVPKGSAMLFISGQLPIDPKTGKLITGDIKALTKQVIDNLEAILRSSGNGLESVVRADVFLTDLKDFAAMNEEYGKRFNGLAPPARQTIQVAALPLGSPVEISCIAVG